METRFIVLTAFREQGVDIKPEEKEATDHQRKATKGVPVCTGGLHS